MTRRWMAPVARGDGGPGPRRPPALLRLLQPALDGQPADAARRATSEADVVRFIDEHGPDYLREELGEFREGRAEGSWENLLYYAARLYYESKPEDGEEWQARRPLERSAGITHLSSRAALRVSSQLMALDQLDPAGLDPRLGADRRGAPGAICDAVIVNIEYPLGLAAYNILRELTESATCVRGVYVLGKAATLNADVGDVLISGVIHDEHSGSTYWLDNAFSFDDIAPFLRLRLGPRQPARGDGQEHVHAEPQLPRLLLPRGLHGGGDGGRPVLQRGLRDLRRRPLPDRRGGLFAKLPIDFGIIHYASDTPYTQARTLGARGLSYFGMDSTYASLRGDPPPHPHARRRPRLSRPKGASNPVRWSDTACSVPVSSAALSAILKLPRAVDR